MNAKHSNLKSLLLGIFTFVCAVGFVFAIFRSTAEADRKREALETTRQLEMAVCAKRGLEAIDLDYPHTPKCLNLQTGIMTVPADLFEIRGGRM